MELLTKEYVFNLGVARGFAASQGIEWLLPGKKLPKGIATECGFDKVTDIVESEKVFFHCAFIAEQNGRDFSPFEFTVDRLNAWEEKADWGVWEEFNKGIYEGMETFWKEVEGPINEIIMQKEVATQAD